MGKSRVLVVGGTGYVGRRIVKASLAEGHPTYVLRRSEIGLDIDKLQMLLEFKHQGAVLIEGSFSDHRSLVEAVKQVDVVICTMSGVHFRSHNLLMQLKLVDAIKEAGNIKGVRREVGTHAKLLNKVANTTLYSPTSAKDANDLVNSYSRESSTDLEITDPVLSDEHSSFQKKPTSSLLLESDKRIQIRSSGVVSNINGGSETVVSSLKESVGHTEIEVAAGAFLGLIVSLLLSSYV